MSLRCSVCFGPKRREVDAAIVGGASNRDIAGRFDLTKSTVDRHRSHVSVKIAAASRGVSRTLAHLVEQNHQRLAKAERWAEESEDASAMVKVVQAAAKLAEVEFGTRTKVEVSGDLATMSDERLDELARELVAKLGSHG